MYFLQRSTLSTAVGICIALCAICHANASIVLPGGAVWDQSGGTVNLGGTNLQVAGQFNLGTGTLDQVGGLSISTGGQFNAGSGTINMLGSWANAGTFIAGTSTVSFMDGAPPLLSGDTTFHNLNFTSNTGQSVLFAAGSTQSVSGLLTIQGTATQPIQFSTSPAGQVAYLNLLPAGTQSIQNVGVSNVYASGQNLAPGQANNGGNGNASNWFGGDHGHIHEIPSLSSTGLLLLSALLLAVAPLRRRTARTH